MIKCIFCGASQTHRVCKQCYDAMAEAEAEWCPICGESVDLPVHDWECFK